MMLKLTHQCKVFPTLLESRLFLFFTNVAGAPIENTIANGESAHGLVFFHNVRRFRHFRTVTRFICACES